MNQSKKSVIVVGAGIGGLATAALLAKSGYKVTILEKNSTIGGRARIFKAAGFLFDMGPSWYMMPEIFEKFYALFGKKTSDFFSLKRLPQLYRVFFSNKDIWDIDSNFFNNKSTLERIEKGSYTSLKEYRKLTKNLYKVAIENFLYTDFSTLSSWLKLFSSLFVLPLKSFLSLDRLLNRYTKNDRLKQVLGYWSVFLGASPKKIPGIYSLMSHVESEGVYYPVGGMGKLVESLKLLCEEYGVEIKTNVSVNRIIKKNGKVTLSTKLKTFTADRVVVNADYQYAEQKLLQERDRSYTTEYWNKKTVAPSMFIMYLGIKGKVKSLKHHNFYFTDNWDKHFDEIFKNPRMPSDPSYYVCAPSKTDSNVAPKGDENLFFLVPIAPGLADTDDVRKSYVKKLLTHFENLIGENISERIVYERVYSVKDFMTDYNAFQGTALGLTHTLLQTAFLRPQIQSKKIPEIYYVGQYTLPGIGVPMVLISAQVVAEKILNNDKQ